jgi:hypothetical protein
MVARSSRIIPLRSLISDNNDVTGALGECKPKASVGPDQDNQQSGSADVRLRRRALGESLRDWRRSLPNDVS